MSEDVSRRSVLRGVAAGTTATGLAGVSSEQVFADAGGADGHIVGLEPGASFDVARRHANEVRHELDFGRIGKAVAGRFPEQALKGLQNNPNVRYVEEDGTAYALAQSLPWGVDRVDADVVHDNGETGSGADVAILDTGIDSDHEDLQGNLGAGKAYETCSGSNCNYDWDDDNGHGTHCAGIADAIDNSTGVVGVSTEATLHAVKVLAGDGSGSYSNIAAGIEYVADQGWDVASMSLGGSSGNSTLKDACTYAQNNGVLLVGAAGNDGPCSDCVGYPAAYSEVIAVSSTASDDSLSSFSSTGSEVELAAPGSDINSTYNDGGYNTLSGTSMACPHVSGAGGQLMANGATNTEARDTLASTAEDIGLASNEQGNGLLDVEAAVSGGGGGGDDKCVDAANWPDGTGYSGYEYITGIDVDGQVAETSSDNAYYDFTCPDVVEVEQGGSFTVSMDFEDSGYDGHYGNIYVDWDGDGSWTSSDETVIMENVNDDTVTYSTTVDVPSDAATGGTLARIRLSYGGFDGPTATGEYGEVNDVTVYVTSGSESAPAVDSLSATEVETSDGDAEFDADWSVSDSDGNLSSVDLTLTDDTAGETEDTASISVSGSDASGTTRLVASGDDGSGNSYTIDCTVTDGQGNTASDSVAASETEETCVDASNWPSGSGHSGYEYIQQVDIDGQVVESSSDNAYYDFTCPDVVTVQQGGSFTIAMDFEDAGYDSHYGNVYVDWDGDGSWSSSDETQIMADVNDDTVTYSATVDVPSDAATGGTLARVRLSYGGFDGPTATGEYGEVNDFTVYVE